jgi:hypothetical protein
VTIASSAPAAAADRRTSPSGTGSIKRVDRAGRTTETLCPGRIPTLSKRWIEPAVVNEIAQVIQDPRVQKAIEAELDLALGRAMGGSRDRQLSIDKEKKRLVEQRQRVIDAIAAGVLSDQEAASKMSEIRVRLEAAQSEGERTQFATRRIKAVSEIRDRVLALTRDFSALAKRAKGSALRELIRPWLADAVFDKRTYVLTLTIRKLPNVIPSSETDGCSTSTRVPSLSLPSRAREVGETMPRRRAAVVVRRLQLVPHNGDWTKCSHGHPFTPANTYVPPGTSRRQCRKCKADRDRRDRRRRAS